MARKAPQSSAPPNSYIIYCRVSTDGQERDGTSLDSQDAACRAYVAAQGGAVVAVIRDAMSGATLQRPGLERARAMMREGQAAALVAYSLDRLSRDQLHIGVIYDDVRRSGGRLEFVTERFEDTATGRFLLHVNAYRAEMERELIRERTMRGRRARVMSGRWSGAGMAPYGYRLDRERGVRVIEEAEAAVVRRIYRWVAEGMTLHAVWRRLNAERIPSPAQTNKLKNGQPMAVGRQRPTLWAAHSVMRILHDPSYKGEAYAYRRRVTVDGQSEPSPRDQWVRLPDTACPAIVDATLWDRVQERLATNRGAATRNRQRPYLLRGLIRCACGHAMSPDTARSGTRYYRCSSRQSAQGKCGSPLINATRCEAAVWEAVAQVLRDPHAMLPELAAAAEDMSSQETEELETARRELRECISRQATLIGRIADMDASLWEIARRELDRLVRRRAELELLVAGLERRTGQARIVDIAALENACALLIAAISTFDFTERRMALETLRVRVTATADRWQVTGAVPLHAPAVGNPFPPSSWSEHAASARQDETPFALTLTVPAPVSNARPR